MYLRSFLIGFLVSLLHCAVGTGPGLQLEDRLSLHLKDREELRGRLRGNTPITDDVIPKFPLPRSLEPLSYNVKIRPILNDAPEIGERFTAPGTVKIVLNCVVATNIITLHSFLLTINNERIFVTNLAGDTPTPVDVLATSAEPDKHFYHITVEGLEAGATYEVQIDYVAPVSKDRPNGLYLTSYEDPETGEPRYMAATQLEPARARQVFPCFDEPRWKPTFEVTIGRTATDMSLGNSPIVDTVVDNEFDGWVWDVCNVTAPMPTYLFAMAVMFNYECRAADEDLYRVPVRICGAKHLIDEGRGDYSAEASAQIMHFFERHYQLNFPMDKVDSIVVPGKGGAMENYGLVTYGDSLLYNADENSENQRQGLVNVIAHELAHQWFGNLVTCVSWSHIYLNEGFATYVSFVGEDEFYDEFHPREYILNDAVQSAFLLDAGPTSHPIIVEDIYTIDQISSHFSNLQYDKGASLIRMMEGFLTEDTLNDGLRAYLRAKENQVAEQDELFAALTAQAIIDGKLPEHECVKEIMDSWTLKRGFPLVRVQYWDANNVYISQERFRNYGQEFPDPGNELWEVPISIATQGNINFQNYTPATWIHKNVNAKIIRHDTSKWIMLNLDAMNFYRVLYDERLLSLIREQLRSDHSVISPLSRSQLLDDYFNLVWQRYVSIERVLELTEYLSNETHFTVWNAFFGNFRSALQILSVDEASDSIKSYLLPRLDGALTKIGLRHAPGDKGALVLLRAQLLDWACSLGHEGCLNYAKELLERWQENANDNQFQIDLQPVLYCTAVANGDVSSVLDFFLQQHLVVTHADHKSRIVAALACASDPTSIDYLLALSLEPESGLSTSESALLLQRFASNSNARSKLFTFLETQLQAIIAFHGLATPVANAITGLSPYYSTAEQLTQVRDFVTTNAEALAAVRTQLDTAITRIEANIQWKLNYYDRIQSWLETHV